MSAPETDTVPKPARQVRRLSLRGADGPVGRARDFTRQAMADWRWSPRGEESVEDVLLVVSELVANATAHAGGATELALAIDGELFSASVADTGARVPAARPAAPGRPGGHGLHIVDALAAAWGTTCGPHGKAVWAAFDA
ncbi:ATP-binding protein [Streptacidiphilus rugosus]|uniref:ATP-binding protein n=1 Tax=Streptacidiphilus rugosus TaxID=405783 RepID=UPI000561E38A|nr:ATP-binding protein [Streptacidiphilus rugosus]